MKKTTQELLEILKKEKLTNYLEENDAELINAPLCTYLTELLEQRGLKKTNVIEKSRIFNIYAYQIFAGKKTPSRDKVIQLSFGFELQLSDTQKLLKTAGLAELYPRNKRDSIIISAIENRLDIMDCDELLYELGQYPLQ